MKKTITLALLFASITTFAQIPTINSNVVAPLGSFNTFLKSNNTTVNTFNPGSAGANATWNFTTLDTTGGKLTQNICKADTCYSFGGFPTSNYAIEASGTGQFGYAYFTNSTYEYFGNDLSGPIFTNAEKFLAFPFTYNNQFTDILNDVDSTFYGSITVKADGYGTLKLPTGTFNGVLRVNAKESYREYTYDGFGDLEDSLFYAGQYYRWFLPNSPNPLLEYAKVVRSLHVGNNVYPVDSNQHLLIYNKKGSTALDEITSVLNLQLYPNPAANNTTLIFEVNENSLLEIVVTNSLGEKVMAPITKTLSIGKQQIAIVTESLPNGIYYVQLKRNATIVTKPLVVQH